MPHNIAVLGSTGSIGTQTLDIIAQFPDRFRATVLAAGSNVDLLIRQAITHRPAIAVIADSSKYNALKEALAPLGIETACGEQALADTMERPDFDTVIMAAAFRSAAVVHVAWDTALVISGLSIMLRRLKR